MKIKSIIGLGLTLGLLGACTNEDSVATKEDGTMSEPMLARIAGTKNLDVKSKQEWMNIYMKEWKTFKADKSLRKKLIHEENSQTQYMDKFDLYLLEKFGSVSINKQPIFSSEILIGHLKAKKPVTGTQEATSPAAGLAKATACCIQGEPATYPSFHNHLGYNPSSYQYNMDGYKGYGEAWTDVGTFNYTAGSLTQFQKRIKHWYGTTWDDFNANWIAVRVDYYNSSGNCLGADYDMNTNDDYVSERRYSSANRGVHAINQIGHGTHSWLFDTAKGVWGNGQTCTYN